MEKLFQDKKSLWNPFVYIAGERALLLGLAIITLSAFIGYLNNAYKLCANLKGSRAGISFTAGFIAAYVLSKIFIGWLAGNIVS